MFAKPKLMKILAPILLVVLIVLAGCDASSGAPTATTLPQAAVIATPASDVATATPASAAPADATAAPTSTAGTTDPANATATTVPAAEAASPTPAAATTAAVASCTKLNLNILSGDQLMVTIPNFSARMVREFQEYRPYDSIRQFRKEIGKYVDAAQVTEWEKYVYVPVDPNKADAETLKQLPGVDDSVAAALVSGRPYPSNDAFLQALAGKVDAQQASAASCYLVTP